MISTDLYTLVPNTSFGLFVFNKSLDKSIRYKHEISYVENDTHIPPFVTISFPSIGIEVMTLNKEGDDIIDHVWTDRACYLDHDNIIGMPFKKFNIRYGNPDRSDIIYLPLDDRQTHRVYDYDSLGLQLWTWRNRIVEIIAYDIHSYEE